MQDHRASAVDMHRLPSHSKEAVVQVRIGSLVEERTLEEYGWREVVMRLRQGQVPGRVLALVWELELKPVLVLVMDLLRFVDLECSSQLYDLL